MIALIVESTLNQKWERNLFHNKEIHKFWISYMLYLWINWLLIREVLLFITLIDDFLRYACVFLIIFNGLVNLPFLFGTWDHLLLMFFFSENFARLWIEVCRNQRVSIIYTILYSLLLLIKRCKICCSHSIEACNMVSANIRIRRPTLVGSKEVGPEQL